MTVPLKGGPNLVKNPRVAGKIVSMLAQGKRQAEAAKAANVSPATACSIVQEHQQEIEERRTEIQRRAGRIVLEGIERATRARVKDASDRASEDRCAVVLRRHGGCGDRGGRPRRVAS